MNNDFLNQSVEFIKGVGPSRSKLLNDELNIKTVKDLIDFYPFRYIDRMSFFKINQLPLNNSEVCLLYTSPSPRDVEESRMPSSA